MEMSLSDKRTVTNTGQSQGEGEHCSLFKASSALVFALRRKFQVLMCLWQLSSTWEKGGQVGERGEREERKRG